MDLSSCHRLESIGNKREMESDNLGLNQAELLEGGWKCKTHTTEIRIPTCSGPFILQRNFLPNPPRIHRKRKEVSAHHVSVTHSILLMAPKLVVILNITSHFLLYCLLFWFSACVFLPPCSCIVCRATSFLNVDCFKLEKLVCY